MKRSTNLVSSHFSKGIAAWEEALGHAVKAKERAFDSGAHFAAAKSNSQHGEFEEYILTAKDRISRPQVFRCIEFFEHCLQWAENEFPDTKGPILIAHARALVMRSPKPWTAMLREMKLVDQIGAYDPDAYAEKKRNQRLNGGQLEFHFRYEETLKHLDHFLQDDCIDLEKSSIDAYVKKLEAALQKARALTSTIEVAADVRRLNNSDSDSATPNQP